MNGNPNGMNNPNTKYCLHCGTLNSNMNRYCISCGAAINLNAPIQQTPIQQPQQPYSQQPFDQPMAPVQVQPYTAPVQGQPAKQQNILTKPVDFDKKFTGFDIFMLLLGIGTVVLGIFVNYVLPVAIVGAVVALFFRKTRWFGLGVLTSFALLVVIAVILVVVLFGMCFAALGGY